MNLQHRLSLNPMDLITPFAHHDLFRFIIVGGGASAVNWLIRFPLSAFMPFVAAVSLAYIIGMIVGFGLYRHWVFPGSEHSIYRQIMKFIAVNILGFLTVVCVSYAVTRLLQIADLPLNPFNSAVAHAFSILSGAGINYTGHRYLTFSRSTAIMQ